MLRLVFQPRLQLPQRDRPVADAVLLLLVHLGEGLAFVFEDGIPALQRLSVWQLTSKNKTMS